MLGGDVDDQYSQQREIDVARENEIFALIFVRKMRL